MYRKVCRIITNQELRKSCLAVDVKRGEKFGIGYIIKMDQTNVPKKIFEFKSEVSRELGRTSMR